MPTEMRTRLSRMPMRCAVLGREFAVRAHRRIKHQRMHVAQRRGAYDQPERIHHAEDLLAAGIADFEAHHRAVQSFWIHAADGGGVGMLRIAREVDALDTRMGGEPAATRQALAHCRSIRSGKVLIPRMVR